MLRFCHSYWTKPALDQRWRVNDQLSKDVWVFALSAHYVKKHHHALVMHTDELGEQVFGILPYDEVHRSLDELTGTHIFWAAGKIYVHSCEPLGTIHIDGDVMIKHPSIYDLIETPGYDLIVQSYDWCPALPLTNDMLRPYLIKDMAWLFATTDGTSLNQAYNCGVVGFHDAGLRRDYVSIYADTVRRLSRSPTLLHQLYENTFKVFPADLVLEQKMLRALADRGGHKVRRIIGGNGRWTERADEYADRYEHLLFMRKYRELDQIQRALLSENPPLYRRVDSHLRELKANAFLS